MIHAIFNVYLALLLIGMLLILLKLHELKNILLTFVDSTKFLCVMIDKLDNNIKKDELSVEERVNRLHEDIAAIEKHMRDKNK